MSDIRSALEAAYKEHSEPTEPQDVVEPQDPTPQDTEPQDTEPQDAPDIKAPSSWKPAAQQAYIKAERGEALTPQEIKILTAEANRRESDFHKGVEEFKTHAQKARAYESVIEPYRRNIEAMGIDAPTAIGQLLQADHTLRTADPMTKAQYFHQLAQQYGVDLNYQFQPQDQQTQYLMQELNQLRQSQEQFYNQIQQQEQMKAQEILTDFASKAEHLDAVRNDMADLLETGKAKDLQDAYEKAVWMNPDIRQSLIEQQKLGAQKAAMASNVAGRAKTAAVSVKGSSPSAGSAKVNPTDLRALLESQFR